MARHISSTHLPLVPYAISCIVLFSTGNTSVARPNRTFNMGHTGTVGPSNPPKKIGLGRPSNPSKKIGLEPLTRPKKCGWPSSVRTNSKNTVELNSFPCGGALEGPRGVGVGGPSLGCWMKCNIFDSEKSHTGWTLPLTLTLTLRRRHKKGDTTPPPLSAA